MLNAISIALIFIFAPGVFHDGLSQNQVKLGEVPLAYITSSLVYMIYILLGRKCNLKKGGRLLLYFAPFVIYGIVRSLFSSYPSNGLLFMASWVVVLFLFSMLSSQRAISTSSVNFFIFTTCFLLVVALFRFFIGGVYDANPFQALNRNAAGFVMFGIFTIELQIYRLRKISKFKHYIFLVLFVADIGLFQSRSLPVAILVHLIFLYRKIILDMLIKRFVYSIIFLASIGVLFLYSPTGERIISHIPTSFGIDAVSDNNNYDRDRFLLIANGLQVISNNLYFGAGPGLENYLYESSNSDFANIRNARPHNFFVSAIADFGVIGCFFFALGFYFFIKRLRNFGVLGHAKFLIPVALLLVFNEYIFLVEIWVFYSCYLMLCNNLTLQGRNICNLKKS